MSQTHRSGHTLMELVTASIAASALLAGLASTMYIGREVAYAPVTSQKVLDSTNTLFELTDELRYALFIVDQSANAIEFVVPDRTGDGVEDSIRYAWGGASGDPLLRTFNHGTATTVADGVEQFQLTYVTNETTEEIETVVESAEQVLWQQATSSGGNEHKLKNDKWCGQHLPPLAQNGGMPSNIVEWKLTKIQYEAKKGGPQNGQFAVQLRPASSGGKPTSDVLDQIIVDETELSSGFAWFEKVFSTPISGLSPHADYAVVYEWLSDAEAAKFRTNESGGSGLLKTEDTGASWTNDNPGEMSYAVFGTYTTPGTPFSYQRKWLERVDVSLQAGANAIGRVDTSARLSNRPEVLTDYVRTNFDANPTLHDVDGDGTSDWKVYGGGSFNTNSLSDGVWTIDNVIETDFDTSDTDNVRIAGHWRGTSNGTYGPYMALLFPLTGSTWGYTAAALNYQPDGTQTATIYDFSGSTTVPILTISGLSAEMHDIELTVLISEKLVRVAIDGVDYGVFSMTEQSGSRSNSTLYVGLSDGAGEFDSVTVAVSEETP